jgi:hypothetical protein
MNAIDPLKTVKTVSMGTATVGILAAQFFLLNFVQDLVGSIMIAGIAFMAGRMSKP